MKLLGMHYANRDGEKFTTLHLETKFESYYDNPDAGRGCVGNRVESVYVGAYDCSGLKPGMDIEIFFDKAITTSRGTFQVVKKIDILTTK